MKKVMSFVLTLSLLISVLVVASPFAAPLTVSATGAGDIHMQANTGNFYDAYGFVKISDNEFTTQGGDSFGKYQAIADDLTSFSFDVKIDPAKIGSSGAFMILFQADIEDYNHIFAGPNTVNKAYYALQSYPNSAQLFITKKTGYSTSDTILGASLGGVWGQNNSAVLYDGNYHTVKVTKQTVVNGTRFCIFIDGSSVYDYTDEDPAIDFSARTNVTPFLFTGAPAGAVTFRTSQTQFIKGTPMLKVSTPAAVDFSRSTYTTAGTEFYMLHDYGEHDSTNGEYAYTFKAKVDSCTRTDYRFEFLISSTWGASPLWGWAGPSGDRGWGVSVSSTMPDVFGSPAPADWMGAYASVNSGGAIGAIPAPGYYSGKWGATAPSDIFDGQYHTFTVSKSQRSAKGETVISLYIDGLLVFSRVDTDALDLAAYSANSGNVFRAALNTKNITLTLADPRSSDTTLSSISVNKKPVEAGGTKIVSRDVNEVEVVAVPNDLNSTVEIFGTTTNLQFGDNVVGIKVIAEDGTVDYHYITVKKEDDINKDIYYIDYNDFEDNSSYSSYSVIHAVQGIVNRETPNLMIVTSNPYYKNLDNEWKAIYEGNGYSFEKITSYQQLAETFKGYFNGIITFDMPAGAASPYDGGWRNSVAELAGVMAGLTGYFPIPANKIASVLAAGLTQPSAVELSQGISASSVSTHLENRFTTWTEPQQYQLDTIAPYANANEFMTMTAEGSDFAVMKKMMYFDLHPLSSQTEEALLLDIYSYFEAKDCVFDVWGYFDLEETGVQLLSSYGGTMKNIGANNMSLFAATPSESTEWKQATEVDMTTPAYDPSKYYVTFIASEGDTPKAPTTLQHGAWKDPNRGQVPINWGLPAVLSEDMPFMLDYYYNNATSNDYFFTSGASLLGWIDPVNMPSKLLPEIAAKNKALAKKTDQYVMDFYSDFIKGNPADGILGNQTRFNSFVDYIKNSGLLGYTGLLFSNNKNSITGSDAADFLDPPYTSALKWQSDTNDTLFINRPHHYPMREGTTRGDVTNSNTALSSTGNAVGVSNKTFNYSYISANINISNNGASSPFMAFETRKSGSGATARAYTAQLLFQSVSGSEMTFNLQLNRTYGTATTTLASKSIVLNKSQNYTLDFFTNESSLYIKIGENVLSVVDTSANVIPDGAMNINITRLAATVSSIKYTQEPVWMQVVNYVLSDTDNASGTSINDHFSVGYYGYIMNGDFSKIMVEDEPGFTDHVVLSPTDLKNAMDYLNTLYPDKFIFTTMDEFAVAAATAKDVPLLSDGTEEETELMPEPEVVIEDGLFEIALGSTLSDLMALFSNNPDNIEVTDVNGNAVTASGSVLGTGTVISLIKSGNIIDSATLYIKGDTDGNGVINSLDLVDVKKRILTILTSDNPAFVKAADADGIGGITVADLVLIKKSIV